jgi:hypothetical protein
MNNITTDKPATGTTRGAGADLATVTDAIVAIRPAGPLLLGSVDPHDERAKSAATFMLPAQFAAAAQWAFDENARGRNVFWTVNTGPPAGSTVARLCIAQIPPDISTHGTYAAARSFLFEEAWPVFQQTASLVVDTGHGLEIFWRLREADKAESAKGAIGAAFGAAAVDNVTRVGRLPGLLNFPTREQIAEGYPVEPTVGRVLSNEPFRVFSLFEVACIVGAAEWSDDMQAEAAAGPVVASVQPGAVGAVAYAGVDEWDEPLDPAAATDAPRLLYEHVPESVAAFAFDRADLIGCDPAAIAMTVIGTLGAMLHDVVKLQPKQLDETYKEAARLWVLLVGDISAKKTPALTVGAGPAYRVNEDLAAESARALKQYNVELRAWKKAGSEGDEPIKPSRLQFVVDDVTVEALGEVCAANPGGVLLPADELSGWLGRMDAYTSGKGSKDRSAWLQAFNGGPRTINRVSSGRGFLSVSNLSCSIVGGIQPGVARELLGGTAAPDGLTQRFIPIVMAPATRGSDRQFDKAAHARVYEIAAHLHRSHAEPATVVMSPAAGALFWDYLDGIAVLTGQRLHSGMGAHLGKYGAILGRLVLAFHAIGCAERGRHPASEPVSATTAATVVRMAREFLIHHARAFYGESLAESPQAINSRKVAEIILARGLERFTLRDIASEWREWRDLGERDQNAALLRLTDLAWLREVDNPVRQRGRGRPPNAVFLVNPRVHTKFKDEAEAARARRKAEGKAWKVAAGNSKPGEINSGNSDSPPVNKAPPPWVDR